MKKETIIMLFVVIAIAFASRGACASEKVDVSGVMRADYYGDAKKASISQMRFNIFAPTATDTYWFARVEPNRYNLDSKDELKLAFVSRGKLTVGRIPLLEGYCLSSPEKLYTVSWPRMPAGFYGYGLQMKFDQFVMLEVSGSPNGTAFRDNGGYSQVSLRLAKGDTNVILRYDDNQNVQVIVSGEEKVENLGLILRGAFYLDSDEGRKKSGGYVFAEKSFGKNFALHLQSDFAQRAETINTVGLRFIHGKNFAILDYEKNADTDRLLGNIVITF